MVTEASKLSAPSGLREGVEYPVVKGEAVHQRFRPSQSRNSS